MTAFTSARADGLQRQEREQQGKQERRSGESAFSHYNHAPGN